MKVYIYYLFCALLCLGKHMSDLNTYFLLYTDK